MSTVPEFMIIICSHITHITFLSNVTYTRFCIPITSALAEQILSSEELRGINSIRAPIYYDWVERDKLDKCLVQRHSPIPTEWDLNPRLSYYESGVKTAIHNVLPPLT